MIGIAVRVATHLGLHRDGAQLGLFPFETEQRRRLWWQLIVLDQRMAEMTGSAIMALSSSGADCRLPLNVNDTDLHPHAEDFPRPHTRPTEMLLCLTRIELTIAAATLQPLEININMSFEILTQHHPLVLALTKQLHVGHRSTIRIRIRTTTPTSNPSTLSTVIPRSQDPNPTLNSDGDARIAKKKKKKNSKLIFKQKRSTDV